MLKGLFSFLLRGETIKKQVKKNKSVVYGGHAVNTQLPFWLRRPARDYDVFSRRPRRSARQLERTLDRESGRDVYFTRPALHEGTHRVLHRGYDERKNTRDDVPVADFTRPPRGLRTKTIGGVRYRTIPQEMKARRKILRDPSYRFRHKKDMDDLRRMKLHQQYKKVWGVL